MAYQIKDVKGRETLDSRANPTVRAEIFLGNGVTARVAVPSGASTGQFRMLELRGRDPVRPGGEGVQRVVENINTVIRDRLIGMNVSDVAVVNVAMFGLDGTKDKSNLGANTTLVVSLAVAQTAAKAQGVPLYRFLGGATSDTLPIPMMNVLNDGAHATNNIDIQEFMIMPIGASSFREGLHIRAEVLRALASILKEEDLSTSVGNEGSYALNLGSDEEAVQYLLRAIEAASYKPYDDFVLAIDAAISEWKNEKGTYLLPRSQKHYTTDELISLWEGLVSKYPIVPLEDALDEEGWGNWKKLITHLGDKPQLVGDDLFAASTECLQRGTENGCGNFTLTKLNQIGSLTEVLNAIKMAHSVGYATIVSRRSDETEDTTTVDLAVAMNTGQIKAGAPSRSEYMAKYNQLLRTGEDLSNSTRYPSKGCCDYK